MLELFLRNDFYGHIASTNSGDEKWIRD